MTFKALIMDDDRDLHAQVRAILEDAGAEVTSAFDSSAGHHAQQVTAFELIVVRTQGLPNLSGPLIVELLRRLGGPSKDAYVIGLSGDMTDRAKCHAAGMTRVIGRPVTKHALLGTLRDWDLVSPRAPSTTAASIAVFNALANPLRLKLLTILARGGPASATALAQEMAMSRQKLEFHLKDLRQAKLVQSRRQGREMLFAARTDDLEAVAQWMIQFAAQPDLTPL
jgi:DNA-binding transcriptional ArsR family regulator